MQSIFENLAITSCVLKYLIEKSVRQESSIIFSVFNEANIQEIKTALCAKRATKAIEELFTYFSKQNNHRK